MKKYILLLLLASVKISATAQIKIREFYLKDGGGNTGTPEKAENQNGKKEKQSQRTEIPTKGNI